MRAQKNDTGPEFECAHCGREVLAEALGTKHRNHCPWCLWSVHLDDRPGDRAAFCGGDMEPVAVEVRKNGEWALIHRCRACAALSANRIAGDDNALVLVSLAVRPLARPAFPLDRLGQDEEHDTTPSSVLPDANETHIQNRRRGRHGT
jgi:DNA-directed RNA polymerase subunit RPC12/RpoP